MSREIYFVCASPGTSGNYVSRLLNDLTSFAITDFTEITFAQSTEEPITRDFFFDNFIVPGDSNTILTIPFRPDYEKLSSRYPNCKIVVVTHSLHECTNIARAYYKSYYQDAYEAGAEPFFRKMIAVHSHLFSDVNCTPGTLTAKEIETCVKILAYQKLLDGFHNLTVPVSESVLEIEFKKLFFDQEHVEQQIEQFVGVQFTEQLKNMSRQLADEYIRRYMNLSRSPFQA